MQQVQVTEFDMSFLRLVKFMVKVALAMIPAAVILLLLNLAFAVIVGGLATMFAR